MKRDPSRLDILLPEADILTALAADMQNGSATIHAPWPFTDGAAPKKRYYVQAAGYSPAISSTESGEYDAEIDDDGFRIFLDPYMAGYVTAQCI